MPQLRMLMEEASEGLASKRLSLPPSVSPVQPTTFCFICWESGQQTVGLPAIPAHSSNVKAEGAT